MERDKELAKLVNVLRRIARSAVYAAWNRVEPDAAAFLVAQYNKVRARLAELEPAVAQAFGPLSESVSAEVVRMAARELAAYFEDEAGCAAPHIGVGIGRGRRRGGKHVWVVGRTGRCW
ncbi:MAG TPA: hypothetical protein VJH03_21105 [Blastocatellia bacterium]|nr:hypothetical protein [Blastocatellia bacterium]